MLSTIKQIVRRHGLLSLLAGMSFSVLILGILRGRLQPGDYFRLAKSREVLHQTVDQLESQNTDLKDEITKIKKSKTYAQKILKDKYHKTEEDEHIIFFAE